MGLFNPYIGDGGGVAMAHVKSEWPHGGTVVPGYERVLDLFVDGQRGLGPGGGALAAYVDGQSVVDLWGGWARPGQPWQAETLGVIMSSTKGMVTVCAQILVDRGQLDIDLPVAHYWPEFSQAGKEGVLVRHVLTHTSGVLGFDVDRRPPLTWDGAGWGDYDAIAAGLAASAPRWEPGTKFGYHATSYGWLMGEIIRRITGQTVGTFFAAEVAGPLGAEVWIGTPTEQRANVAFLTDTMASGLPLPLRLVYGRIQRRMRDQASMPGQAFVADGSFSIMDKAADMLNGGGWLDVELPFGNGTATARALARVYAVLAMEGELDGIRLLSPEVVRQFSVEAIAMPDQLMTDTGVPGLARLLSKPTKRTIGYMKNPSMLMEAPRFGPNPEAFGHDGAGGQIAFCDLENRISVGFVRNDLTSVSKGSTRLITALYECAAAIGSSASTATPSRS
jgi:CubicO group peptidase (beta-lactamase class C family)